MQFISIGLLLFIFVIIFQLIYIIITLSNKEKSGSYEDFKEIKMSILIPAYNEEAVLENCLQGLKKLKYKNFESIFINDGSSDNTMELLNELLDLEIFMDYNLSDKVEFKEIKLIYKSKKYADIFVIDKKNGGKADSLNAGISLSTGDVIITLDADSILDLNSIQHINNKFQDNSVIAAGGMVHVGQMMDKTGKPQFRGNFLLKYQLSEYLTSFYVRKLAQSKLNMLSIVSGAFGAFRKELLYEIGGYKKSLGEDMEITLRIQKVIQSSNRKLKMVFIPKAFCYTEVPENIFDIFKQRTRWQKGFIDCFVKYYKDLFTTLGIKFSLFLLWDALLMSTLGILTSVVVPILIFTDNITTYFLICFVISILLQFVFRLVGYWTAAKYNHKYTIFSYIRIILFFLLEVVVRPFAQTFVFVYACMSYFLQKDKHNWNKMKRLGNVKTEEFN